MTSFWFTQFSGFEDTETHALQMALTQARDMCTRCTTSLVYHPNGLPRRTVSLLNDAFDIRRNERDKIRNIQSKFLSFGTRMTKTTLTKTTENSSSSNELGHKAFVVSNNVREIFIVSPSFFRQPPRVRALTLIHEYIHLLFPTDGHPGEQQVLFERSRLGIPYDDASRNAYCYEYFADWLTSGQK
tara:strand:- start:94 stop:651 length:558 start_codon:yes stop_codon:yes gene_type:complete